MSNLRKNHTNLQICILIELSGWVLEMQMQG